MSQVWHKKIGKGRSTIAVDRLPRTPALVFVTRAWLWGEGGMGFEIRVGRLRVVAIRQKRCGTSRR